jgi:hypothetical protein
MSHVEVLVGVATKVVTCRLCSKPIEVGELAAYVRGRGSHHVQCWLGRDRS